MDNLGLVLLAIIVLLPLALFLIALRRIKKLVRDHDNTTEQLRHSREMLQMYAKQTEQFSLSAASILSIKDEKQLFARISDAIVKYSDFSRVLISLFYDTPPYRELIGYAGVSEEIVEKVKKTELKKYWYDKVFTQGIRLGQASFYIPHTMKHILNQEATIYGNGDPAKAEEGWHPEDNLFVRMSGENGEFLGVISVDTSKSGRKPTDEVIRPLEIYASLISQILILKRNQRLREDLQNQLRQAQKMEAIGKLTGGIAHDFNNILAIIIGNVELAQMVPGQPDSSNSCLEEIKRASFRARDIVRHLLAYSRKTPDELKPINIRVILEESLSFLRSTLPSTIAIAKEIDVDDALVLANPTQIHQIMLNLCTNAVQAMEEKGGRLSVQATITQEQSLKDMSGKILPPGRYVRIIVKDTGHGIGKEIVERIFDPYFTTKEVGKGTGMGLAIVHGIVQGHSGAISVASILGEGSTFCVHLPLYEWDAHQQPSGGATVSGGNERILLIDDDAALLATTRQHLQHLGYHVEAVASPLRALEIFSTAPTDFDLVMTDMTMPEMTGDILAGKVLAIRGDLPIFLCTGYSDKVDREQAEKLGIRRYFDKPLAFDEVARAIRQVLAENNHRRQPAP